jgi:hypothetical protein
MKALRKKFAYRADREQAKRRLDQYYAEEPDGTFADLIFRASHSEERADVDALCAYLRSSNDLTADDRDRLARFIEHLLHRMPRGRPPGPHLNGTQRTEQAVVREVRRIRAETLRAAIPPRARMRRMELEQIVQRVLRETPGADRIDAERIIDLLQRPSKTLSVRRRTKAL